MLSYLNDPTKELLGKIGGGVKAESSNTGNLLWDNPQDNNQMNDVLFNLSKHCKQTFSTESGMIMLNFLIAEFLDQPTSNFGYSDGEQTRNYAIWRDGNNHVVREILKLYRSAGEII